MKNLLKKTKELVISIVKDFFSPVKWVFSLFKKKPVVIPPPPKSAQEIENDKHRSKYRVEAVNNIYYVQYYFDEEWWYLRITEEDFLLEERKDEAVQIRRLPYLENIITRHQSWLSEGHRFLPFK